MAKDIEFKKLYFRSFRQIEDFYNKMSQELLYTFFALFDYYYIADKKEINELKDKKQNISIQYIKLDY